MNPATMTIGRPSFDVGLVYNHRQSSPATQQSAFSVRSGSVLDLTSLLDPLLPQRFSLWCLQFSIAISSHQQQPKQLLDLFACSSSVTVCSLCRGRRTPPPYIKISGSISSPILASQNLTEPIPSETCNVNILVLLRQRIALHNNTASQSISSLKREILCGRDIAPTSCQARDIRLYVHTGAKNRQLLFLQQRMSPVIIDAFPLYYPYTMNSQVLKPVPVKASYALSLLLEPIRNWYTNANALPVFYLKLFEFVRFTTWPLVTLLLSPYEPNNRSSFKLDLPVFQPQRITASFTSILQASPHWYEISLDLTDPNLCAEYEFGCSSLHVAMASSDSLIRLIGLLVGIPYGLHLLFGWFLVLDAYLGVWNPQAYLEIEVHRADLRHVLAVIVLHCYKATSLAVESSRVSESIISLLLLCSMVKPEWFTIIRRYIVALRNAILFQTVQKRTKFSVLLLFPMLGSNECLIHLSLGKFGCIFGYSSLDIPPFPMLFEALSPYVYAVYLSNASSLFFIDVT